MTAHWRLAAVAAGLGLLVVASVLAFDPPRPAVPLHDPALAAAVTPRMAVACSSPWERWTGHDYDHPTGLSVPTPSSYEAGVLDAEAGESACLLESGDHEEILTILTLLAVVLLAGVTVRRRPASGQPPPASQRRRIQRSARTNGTTATTSNAT